MRTSTALTFLAIASSPILGAPTSPDPNTSDITSFPTASASPSLPNSPNLDLDLPTFAALRIVDLEEVELDGENKRNETATEYDEWVRHQRIGAARQKLASAVKAKPTKMPNTKDRKSYGEYRNWLKQENAGQPKPNIEGYKVKSEDGSPMEGRSIIAKPSLQETMPGLGLLKMTNTTNTLKKKVRREVSKLSASEIAAPAQTSLSGSQLSLTKLSPALLNNGKRGIDTAADHLRMNHTHFETPSLARPKPVGVARHRLRRSAGFGHGLSNFDRPDVVDYSDGGAQ